MEGEGNNNDIKLNVEFIRQQKLLNNIGERQDNIENTRNMGTDIISQKVSTDQIKLQYNTRILKEQLEELERERMKLSKRIDRKAQLKICMFTIGLPITIVVGVLTGILTFGKKPYIIPSKINKSRRKLKYRKKQVNKELRNLTFVRVGGGYKNNVNINTRDNDYRGHKNNKNNILLLN